jgi:hypothetical protein
MSSIGDGELTKGIGTLLREKRVRVPFYQRSYAWRKPHVETLLHDLRRAIENAKPYYFLGSIVGCKTANYPDEVEVVDGQQRLATVSMLLAAFRNHLLKLEDPTGAGNFESKYLFETEETRNPKPIPRMTLSETDNHFFQRVIIERPDNGHDQRQKRKKMLAVVPEGPRSSHKLIADAMSQITKFVEREIAGTRSKDEQKGRIDQWEKYIRLHARVLFITVDSVSEAFIVFETLNDRGLELTIADIAKNYLFSRSGDRIEEVRYAWQRMTGHFVASTDSKITKEYLHHLWCSIYGVTRDKELFKAIQDKITNEGQCADFAAELANNAEIYAATYNSDSPALGQYASGANAKKHVAILNRVLRVSQVRILLLATFEEFTSAEAAKVLSCCICWSVRFSVAGGSPSDQESLYTLAALKIRGREIKDAKGLAEYIAPKIPNDDIFRFSFAELYGISAQLARYYLQCLQLAGENSDEPFLGDNDEKKGTLEHIYPQSPDGTHWPKIDPEDLEDFVGQIGNLALLIPADNTDRGNAPFSEAKQVYGRSNFEFTKRIPRYANGAVWDQKAISKRAADLANDAVKAWPVVPASVAAKPRKKPLGKSKDK